MLNLFKDHLHLTRKILKLLSKSNIFEQTIVSNLIQMHYIWRYKDVKYLRAISLDTTFIRNPLYLTRLTYFEIPYIWHHKIAKLVSRSILFDMTTMPNCLQINHIWHDIDARLVPGHQLRKTRMMPNFFSEPLLTRQWCQTCLQISSFWHDIDVKLVYRFIIFDTTKLPNLFPDLLCVTRNRCQTCFQYIEFDMPKLPNLFPAPFLTRQRCFYIHFLTFHNCEIEFQL